MAMPALAPADSSEEGATAGGAVASGADDPEVWRDGRADDGDGDDADVDVDVAADDVLEAKSAASKRMGMPNALAAAAEPVLICHPTPTVLAAYTKDTVGAM